MISKKETVIYPPFRVERKQPVNAISVQPSAFFKNVNKDFKPVNLFEYSNVNVTPEGIVFKGFQIDEDLLIYPKHTKIYNFLYLGSSMVKRKKIRLPENEKYLLCYDYWSNSIFHWMCDAMPRIEAVKEFAKECVLLLPKDFTYPYILETLKAFEFKGIYRFEDNEYVNCRQLYAPQQITTSGQINPKNILSLRKTILAYFEPKFSGNLNFPNIYISRNKAKYRKVINESEIMPLLNKFNFEVIFFEDYSVAEQIEMCYHAENIVSIHGANLTNVLFMQPGKNVLELRKKDDLDNNYFYELTDSVDCNYYYLNCEFEDLKPGTNTFSLYADVNDFENSLKRLTNAR